MNSRFTLALLVAALFLVGCGETTEECEGDECDAKELSGELCEKDLDCDDDLFCTGKEVCNPEDEDADKKGCVAGKEPSCEDDIECTVDTCDKKKDRCVSNAPDEDGDGHGDAACLDEDDDPIGDDCDDDNADRYPGNIEVCNPTTFGEKDEDGDGSISDQCCNGEGKNKRCGPDCDDKDLARRPGQVEFCDEKDNDCDGEIDEERNKVDWYPDKDGDLFGAVGDAAKQSCEIIAGHSILAKDCNDDDVAQNPITVEQCGDDIDNNCNGLIDEGVMCKEPEGRPVEEKPEPDDCGDIEHGTTDTRIRFEATEVPGDDCESEEQGRECDDGELSKWSGDFEETSCKELPAGGCGELANGADDTRTRYKDETVAFGEQCSGEKQTNTCQDGDFQSWTGDYKEASCSIKDAAPCGSIAHGGSDMRSRFEKATVPFDDTCVSKEQTRTCADGVFLEWNGTHTFTECEVSLPEGAIEGYIKASAPQAGDYFGQHALSVDGNTLAVVVRQRDAERGAIYVYQREGELWKETAYLLAASGEAGDLFGVSLALSANGDTLAVGALGEDSSTSGIDSTPNELASQAGAAYVFVRDESDNWSPQAYIKPSVTQALALFGNAIALSASGDRLAVSSRLEETPLDSAGAVYIFERSGSEWSETSRIAPNEGSDQFGDSLSLSGDGKVLTVGAPYEDSSTSGVNSVPNDSLTDSGAAYIYRESEGEWSEDAYLKANYAGANDLFGSFVKLSDSGTMLAVTASDEDSASSGIDSIPADNGNADDSGAVYLFRFDGESWMADAYPKASNSDAGDKFGYWPSFSSSGDRLVVGSPYEDSASTGFKSTPNDNETNTGAGYLFENIDGVWEQIAYIKAPGPWAHGGSQYTLTGDGQTLAFGSQGDDSSSSGINSVPNDNGEADDSGAVYIYDLSEELP